MDVRKSKSERLIRVVYFRSWLREAIEQGVEFTVSRQDKNFFFFRKQRIIADDREVSGVSVGEIVEIIPFLETLWEYGGDNLGHEGEFIIVAFVEVEVKKGDSLVLATFAVLAKAKEGILTVTQDCNGRVFSTNSLIQDFSKKQEKIAVVHVDALQVVQE